MNMQQRFRQRVAEAQRPTPPDNLTEIVRLVRECRDRVEAFPAAGSMLRHTLAAAVEDAENQIVEWESWLDDNRYDVTAEKRRLGREYAAEGHHDR